MKITWPENCIYNSGHSQQDQPPKGTLWQVFTNCSSHGSNQPLPLDTLSLEVQIESFKYTKFVAGFQTSGPQLFHPDTNGFITDSAAQNFPVHMAIDLSHTILDNSLEINDINLMYKVPAMTTNTGLYVQFTRTVNNLQLDAQISRQTAKAATDRYNKRFIALPNNETVSGTQAASTESPEGTPALPTPPELAPGAPPSSVPPGPANTGAPVPDQPTISMGDG